MKKVYCKNCYWYSGINLYATSVYKMDGGHMCKIYTGSRDYYGDKLYKESKCIDKNKNLNCKDYVNDFIGSFQEFLGAHNR